MVRAPALILIAAVLVTGCNEKRTDSCINPPSASFSSALPNDFGGYSGKLDGCLARWGIRLSRSEGDLGDIADAVVGGCQDALDYKTSFYIKESPAPVLEKPDFDETIEKFRKLARGQALFYVALGRAGNCPLP